MCVGSPISKPNSHGCAEYPQHAETILARPPAPKSNVRFGERCTEPAPTTTGNEFHIKLALS